MHLLLSKCNQVNGRTIAVQMGEMIFQAVALHEPTYFFIDQGSFESSNGFHYNLKISADTA